mmetsp:Transcript_6990/g.12838  ORF Transcript_6990/g.12838 Transcript_6990/m.12838 type:complete len:403 (-) Transcript_6990:618-1826(-)
MLQSEDVLIFHLIVNPVQRHDGVVVPLLERPRFAVHLPCPVVPIPLPVLVPSLRILCRRVRCLHALQYPFPLARRQPAPKGVPPRLAPVDSVLERFHRILPVRCPNVVVVPWFHVVDLVIDFLQEVPCQPQVLWPRSKGPHRPEVGLVRVEPWELVPGRDEDLPVRDPRPGVPHEARSLGHHRRCKGGAFGRVRVEHGGRNGSQIVLGAPPHGNLLEKYHGRGRKLPLVYKQEVQGEVIVVLFCSVEGQAIPLWIRVHVASFPPVLLGTRRVPVGLEHVLYPVHFGVHVMRVDGRITDDVSTNRHRCRKLSCEKLGLWRLWQGVHEGLVPVVTSRADEGTHPVYLPPTLPVLGFYRAGRHGQVALLSGSCCRVVSVEVAVDHALPRHVHRNPPLRFIALGTP